MGINMRAYSAQDYIKLEDVTEGPLEKTIAEITEGSFDKLEATFTDGSKLSLNKTSTLALGRAYGFDGDDCIGKRVEIYAGEVTFKGVAKPGILVRPIDPPTPASERRPLHDELDDEIPL
jgi:hypothetical protein